MNNDGIPNALFRTPPRNYIVTSGREKFCFADALCEAERQNRRRPGRPVYVYKIEATVQTDNGVVSVQEVK